jgi:beta-1,4-mannosyltransferase
MEIPGLIQNEKECTGKSMNNAYLYPITARGTEITNPYLTDFMDSLSGEFSFVNREKPSDKGIMDMLRYLKNIDFVFLNWIEDLPEKKAGWIQSMVFVLCLGYFRLRGIKIFYTLHNRESHFGKYRRLKNFLKRQVIRRADYILCHASEGLQIIPPKYRNKTRFITHPFRSEPAENHAAQAEFDLIIWGTIKPYKGIDSFLKYLESAHIIDKYKICIVGKIVPASYEQVLSAWKRPNITIDNRFIDDNELNQLIHKSSIVLFTYLEKSVLSSGALVYSLSQGAPVIGPDAGAFRDLNREGLLDVFDKYDEMILKIDAQLKNPHQHTGRIIEFIRNNTWKEFGKRVSSWIIKNPLS